MVLQVHITTQLSSDYTLGNYSTTTSDYTPSEHRFRWTATISGSRNNDFRFTAVTITGSIQQHFFRLDSGS